MKYIKLFENFNGTEDIIIIIGLPGSGKTTLANTIKSEHPEKEYIILDDYQYRALDEIKEHNLIISDTTIFHGFYAKIKDIEEKCKLHGKTFKFYYFENDPEACINNVKLRWETMGEVAKLKQRQQNPNTLEHEILLFSQHYKTPPGETIIPVFKKS